MRCATQARRFAATPMCILSPTFWPAMSVSSSINVGNPERKVVVNGLELLRPGLMAGYAAVEPEPGACAGITSVRCTTAARTLAVFVPEKGLVIQGNGISDVFPPDKNNFAPRIGFAFQPTSRQDLVVRGAFGVFYDQINMNPFLDFRPPNNADGLEDNPAGPAPVSAYSTKPIGAKLPISGITCRRSHPVEFHLSWRTTLSYGNVPR